MLDAFSAVFEGGQLLLQTKDNLYFSLYLTIKPVVISLFILSLYRLFDNPNSKMRVVLYTEDAAEWFDNVKIRPL